MNTEALPWISVALASGAAAFFGWRLRQRTREAGAHARVEADLAQRLAAAEKRLGDREKAHHKHHDELSELRHKLDKAKRRALRAQGDQRDEHGRIRELEDELRLARGERQAAIEELEQLRSARQVPVRPPPPTPVVPAPAPAAPVESEARARLAEQCEQQQAQIAKLDGALAQARADGARQRRRAANLDTAYTALRGELEAKKDRLRTQQEELERLRALRVTFADEVRETRSAAAEEAAAETPPDAAQSAAEAEPA